MASAPYVYAYYPHGQLDKQVAAFLGGLAVVDSPPLSALSPQEVRQSCDISGWAVRRDAVHAQVDLTIPMPGGALPLRIYSPSDPGPLPVLVYFHGGGWVFGTLDQADHVCGAFAQRTPCVVVSVDYRLSPEHKYPAAVEDAYAAVEWVERHIAAWGGDPQIIAVGGESAGANLAAVVCRLARDRNGPRIAYQLLLCPWTDLSATDTRSCEEFGDGPWLPRRNLAYYRAQYLDDVAVQVFDPNVSPQLAADLGHLPPAHIVTAEFDVLRDDGEAYARRLREAGVPVTCQRYDGMIHSFMLLNAVFACADQCIHECVTMLRAAVKGPGL